MMLRLPIPELNEERRIELTKVAGGYAESATNCGTKCSA